MIESRCGILCYECGYKEKVNCKGCTDIEKPFWGEQCPVKSCCEDKNLIHCGLCVHFHVKCLINLHMTKNKVMMAKEFLSAKNGLY